MAAIMAALRAEGELDDTLIVFTSDNGYFYGEHGIQNGKVLAYEPSIRVPLVLRGPGVPAGARRRQLVTNADLAPTILAAAGGVPGKVQDGRSLFPLLDDPGLEWGRDLLVEGAAGLNQPAYDALRTYRYTFVEYTTGERELYDLERDPFQLQSLHADPAHAEVQEELARRLARLRDCAGTDCWAAPRLRLTLRSCRARVLGPAIERASFRSGRRVNDRRPPFSARVAGARVRVRVRTLDGRVRTLDRVLPAGCGSAG